MICAIRFSQQLPEIQLKFFIQFHWYQTALDELYKHQASCARDPWFVLLLAVNLLTTMKCIRCYTREHFRLALSLLIGIEINYQMISILGSA